MNEYKIISQCLTSDEYLMMHSLYTELKSIRDPFVKKIFEIILDIYGKNQIPDVEKIFYALPEETRKKDLQKICEGML